MLTNLPYVTTYNQTYHEKCIAQSLKKDEDKWHYPRVRAASEQVRPPVNIGTRAMLGGNTSFPAISASGASHNTPNQSKKTIHMQ